MSNKALIKTLVKDQLVTQAQLQQVKIEQRRSGESFTSILLRHGFLDYNTMREKIADIYGLPSIDLKTFDLDREALDLLPAKECRKNKVIPISKAGSSLVVAFADPTNIVTKDRISYITKCKVQMMVALDIEINRAIDKYYGVDEESASDIVTEMHAQTEDEADINISNEVDEKSADPVVRFVRTMLLEAIRSKASDIHVEPNENYLRVRFRKDGTLVEKYRPPAQIARALTSRLKVMSRLDITETRKPQDGRLKIHIPNKPPVDFRMSVLPTITGEKVVLRILDKSNLKLDLRDLGFESNELEKFLSALRRPQGLILTTGPTGSGKTTTLYSAINEIHDISRNISTAEDPVEFNIDGINQVQVRPDIGFDFAEALRSFLRQDPDVILVGEIRDQVTGKIAFEAASTGHLVLSTLHTNDATKTIDRLIHMGIPGFLITSTVEMILAQRLIRKNCESCKTPDRVTPEVLRELGLPESEIHDFQPMTGSGCAACDGTGKSGRLAIYEVMPMTDKIRDAILSEANELQMRRSALSGGMTSLRMSGIVKIKQGLASIQEVLAKTMKDPEF